MSQRITIELPWPPSANDHWVAMSIPVKGSVRCPKCGRNKTHATVILSEDGRAYRQAVGRVLFAAKIVPSEVRVAVEIHLYPPSARTYDIDNGLKEILDALRQRKVRSKQAGGMRPDPDQLAAAIYDDSVERVGRLTVEPHPFSTAKVGRVVVVLTPMPGPQVGLPFDEPGDAAKPRPAKAEMGYPAGVVRR